MKEIKEYYRQSNTGQLRKHYFEKDGKTIGEYKEWFHDGRFRVRSLYSSPGICSEYIRYFSDGAIWFHQFYKIGDITDAIEALVININDLTPEEKMLISLKFGITKFLC